MSRIADIAAGGMAYAAARLSRSAQNVANLNTDGYVPVAPIAQADLGGGVSMHNPPAQSSPNYTSSGRIDSESGTDLAQETVEQIGALTAFKANIAVLKTDDEMQRAVLDIKV